MTNELKLIFENKEKELKNIKNYLLNIDKYDTRVIYLSVCNKTVMDSIRLLFLNEDYQTIKEKLLTKISPYFEEVVLKFNDKWRLEELEDTSLKFIVQDDKKNPLMAIDAENKKIEIELPEYIKSKLDIDIPYETNRKNILLAEQSRLLSTLNEQTITKPSDYTRKLLAPKRHAKQVDTKCREINVLINEIDDNIDRINQECQSYFNSQDYQQRLQLCNELEKFIQLRN